LGTVRVNAPDLHTPNHVSVVASSLPLAGWTRCAYGTCTLASSPRCCYTPPSRNRSHVTDRNSSNDSRRTLLVGLAHPDDELGMAGTILAQVARGDRVVIVWLTRGEQTEAFGPLTMEEVGRRREEQGHLAGRILGAETRFLDFRDTAVRDDRESVVEVARVICEYQPDGLLTWGDAWIRGMRHPDHQACGRIFRDAITLARIAKVVSPLPPHRKPMPVFTLRDEHSQLPAVGVDVTPYRERIAEVAALYLQGVGFGDPVWLEGRLRQTGSRWGYRYAEEFDAWESRPGGYSHLLPAPPLEGVPHPDRTGDRAGSETGLPLRP
jgi:LmbE family N-acetylglucosaminyl deacetylase